MTDSSNQNDRNQTSASWGNESKEREQLRPSQLQTPQEAQPLPGHASPRPNSASNFAQPSPHQHPSSSQGRSGAATPYVPSNRVYTSSAMTSPKKTKGHGWIIAIVCVVSFFLLAALSIVSCSTIAGTIGNAFVQSEVPSGNAIGIINMSGSIQYDGSTCSPEGLKRLLDKAEADPNTKALVLRVNSGGGAAAAGEEMASYLKNFSKPVVVSSASINASAAYEISSQADYIYVVKSTEIGSIGTALELTNLSGLLEMLGIDIEVITSADSKDSSYGYRPLTEQERAHYQNMINQINESFIATVAEGRHMRIEDVRALATGLSFTGIDAVQNGLADEIGSFEEAKKKAAELAGLSHYDTYNLQISNQSIIDLYKLLGKSQSDLSELAPFLKHNLKQEAL